MIKLDKVMVLKEKQLNVYTVVGSNLVAGKLIQKVSKEATERNQSQF